MPILESADLLPWMRFQPTGERYFDENGHVIDVRQSESTARRLSSASAACGFDVDQTAPPMSAAIRLCPILRTQIEMRTPPASTVPTFQNRAIFEWSPVTTAIRLFRGCR
jgi:hypothetical protein